MKIHITIRAQGRKKKAKKPIPAPVVTFNPHLTEPLPERVKERLFEEIERRLRTVYPGPGARY